MIQDHSEAPPPPEGRTEIAAGVFVFQSRAYAMNSGVVLGPGSDGGGAPALLVDPGYLPGEIEGIAALLELRRSRAGWIVLTHADWDHVVGAASFGGARIVASGVYPERAQSERGAILESAAAFDRSLGVDRKHPLAVPGAGTLVGSPSDLVWSGPACHFLPAGGHSPDGLMVLLRGARVLFAGDYISDREIPFVGESVAAYLRTLDLVEGLVRRGEIETLVPGHGAVCGCAEIRERIAEDRDYLVRLEAWVRETRRTVGTLAGILERCEEVVFRKGCEDEEVRSEHRRNVERAAHALGTV